MPQQILPLIPRGATEINGLVSVWREEERWTYFIGTYPIYSHDKTDQQMFHLITSQMIESGACRQVDIITTFGVSKSSVIRSVNKLRKEGAKGFFVQRRGRLDRDHSQRGRLAVSGATHDDASCLPRPAAFVFRVLR